MTTGLGKATVEVHLVEKPGLPLVDFCLKSSDPELVYDSHVSHNNIQMRKMLGLHAWFSACPITAPHLEG